MKIFFNIFKYLFFFSFLLILVFFIFRLTVKIEPITINQNLIRNSITDGKSLYFSTLEGYNLRLGQSNKTQLVKYDLSSNSIDSIFLINNSSEIRSLAIENHNLILGASLDPAIYKFNLLSNDFVQLYNGKGEGMWIHELALFDNSVYFSLSSPIPKDSNNFEINVLSFEGKLEKIEIPLFHSQGYSGIQTVKPDGTIFFWIGYPISFYEYNPRTKRIFNRQTKICGELFTKISWDYDSNGRVLDLWSHNNSNFLFYSNSFIDFDLNTFDFVSDSLLKVDLFHKNDTQGKYYFSLCSGDFYIKNDFFNKIDDIAIDPNFKLFSHFSDRPEYPINFFDQGNYNLGLIGLVDNKILFNLTDTKKFKILSNEKTSSFNVNVNNLTKSDITSLLYFNDTTLFSGGYLTTLDIAIYNKKNKSHVLFQESIHGYTGQISNFLPMNDSIVFFAGYPKGLTLKYNFKKAWNPSSKIEPNPNIINLENDSSDFERVTKLLKVNKDLFISLSVTDYADSKFSKIIKYNSSGCVIDSCIYPFYIKDIAVSSNSFYVLAEEGTSNYLNLLTIDFNFCILNYESVTYNSFFLTSNFDTVYLVKNNNLFSIDSIGNFNFIFNFFFDLNDGLVLPNKDKIILRSQFLVLLLDLSTSNLSLRFRPFSEWFLNRNNWNALDCDAFGNIYYSDLDKVKSFNINQF